MPAKGAYHRAEVHAALQVLANQAIHAAFDRPIGVRQVERIRTWISRAAGSKTSRQNLEQCLAASRTLGTFALPPSSQAESLAALLNHYDPLHSDESARPQSRTRGRRMQHSDDLLVLRLCVCYRTLFGVTPDYSRGRIRDEESDNFGELRRRGGTARFIHAFYEELERAIVTDSIDDPEGRGRTCSLKVPSVESIAKRVRAIAKRADWSEWALVHGQVLATR